MATALLSRYFAPVSLLLMTTAWANPDLRHDKLFWFLDEQGQKQAVQSPADWEKRREQVLKNMQKVIGPLPDRSRLPPLDLKITKTFQGDGYQRHTCSFANLFDERVTAYLYVSNGIKPGERRPGALALHPTGDEGKAIVDGRGPYQFNRAYGLSSRSAATSSWLRITRRSASRKTITSRTRRTCLAR